MRKGKTFIICGPSGVGKGTVVARLLASDPSLYFSVSATTRPPRPGEEDGLLALPLPCPVDETAGGGAVVVLEHYRLLRHHGLLLVIGAGGAADTAEVLRHPPLAFLVGNKPAPQHLGDGLLGKVVVGRAQPPGGDDHIRPGEGQLHRLAAAVHGRSRNRRHIPPHSSGDYGQQDHPADEVAHHFTIAPSCQYWIPYRI